MPTGYTYKIEEDENYTARQYIEHCAHCLSELKNELNKKEYKHNVYK